jgi:hypothetical protein
MTGRKSNSNRSKQPAVREGVATYEVRSIAEVFWLAFKSLSVEDRDAFIDHLLNDPEFYEDIADAVLAIEARAEPSRPFEDFVEELRREGRV